jgi:demethylmenaquinone methyltransferase/2-methoxy-6-polyprenyl-1,4-benzoquinol methylase
MCDSYKPVSKYYNLLSNIYSLGQIAQCRNAFADEISKAISNIGLTRVDVCFAGVGHGAEAISLAEKGAMVTVVEISASMLVVFQRELDHASDEAKSRVQIIHGDIRNVQDRYDWVVANFFLNIFSESEMVELIDDLLGKCSLQGSLVIGDFYYDAEGSRLARILQKMNWNLALAVFCTVVKNAKHPIYDYGEYLSKRDWSIESEKKFGFLGVSFYRSAKFVKARD